MIETVVGDSSEPCSFHWSARATPPRWLSPCFFAKLPRMTQSRRCLLYAALIVLASLSLAQQHKTAPSVTGHYEGSAKNNAGEVITVAIDLTEKDGALTGTINSSHGDFAITGGSHQGEAVTIEFGAGDVSGTISLHRDKDSLAGTWTAGDDGGSFEVKKVAAKEDPPKGRS